MHITDWLLTFKQDEETLTLLWLLDDLYIARRGSQTCLVTSEGCRHPLAVTQTCLFEISQSLKRYLVRNAMHAVFAFAKTEQTRHADVFKEVVYGLGTGVKSPNPEVCKEVLISLDPQLDQVRKVLYPPLKERYRSLLCAHLVNFTGGELILAIASSNFPEHDSNCSLCELTFGTPRSWEDCTHGQVHVLANRIFGSLSDDEPE